MSFIQYGKKIIIAILLLAGIAVGIVYWWTAIHPYQSTDNAYLKAHISLISPKQTGYVKQVLFNDNQRVAPGDELVIIDSGDFQTKVAQADAQVQVERAHIQTLETDKNTQSAKIRQAEASISAADADLNRASKDLQRFGNLADEGAVSLQTRDSADSVHKQAAALKQKVLSARVEAESQLAALDAQINETRARLNAAQAVMELAGIDLQNTRITAPIAGVMGNRSVQVGQLVQPGQVLGYLIPSEGLFVEANFKETQLDKMQVGQPVEIKVDAYPDQVFKGIVDSFAPASGSEFSLLPAENATGNFTKIVRRVTVKIRFELGNDLGQLRPGLSTVVKVKVL